MTWAKLNVALRDAIMIGIAVFAAGAIVGTVVYLGAAQGLKSEVQRNLIDIAKSAANLTDIAAHQRVTKPEDKGNSDYEAVRRPYLALLRANPDLAYIYTNVERDGKLRFIMDSSIPKPGEKDIPTDVLQDYPDATATLKAAFASHEAKVEEEPYTDEWGTFLSAYAPLFDGDTFIGTVGVDIRTTRFQARMAKLQGSVALGMAATLLVSLCAGFVVYRFRRKAVAADQASSAQALELSQLRERAVEAERQEAVAALARQKSEAERTQAFRAEIERLLISFGEAADGLYHQARSFADMARSSGEKISRVASASDDSTKRTEYISRSTHELSASIGEISKQSGLSQEISMEASRRAEDATAALRELNAKSDSVGEVIGLISEIASQINLLALNATIESARAGEAGKGFAVVATEVKNLSNRVGVASQDIARQISDVQAAAQHSTEAMEGIQGTIDQVLGTSQSVASAVSQQMSVTSDIEVRVAQSMQGSYAMASDLAGIRETAEETDKAARFIEETALKVRSGAKEMASHLETFTRALA